MRKSLSRIAILTSFFFTLASLFPYPLRSATLTNTYDRLENSRANAYTAIGNPSTIDDMEDVTDWSSSDATNTPVSLETTTVKVGSGALKIATTATASNADVVSKTISAEDWSDREVIGFWIQSGATGQLISVEIDDDTAATDPHYDITISTASTWEYNEWDLTGIAAADRDSISAFKFIIDDDALAPVFYIDQLQRYDPADAGDTTISVSSASGIIKGDTITLKSSTNGGCSTSADEDVTVAKVVDSTTLSLTSALANCHAAGGTVHGKITSTHEVKFTSNSPISGGGDIIVYIQAEDADADVNDGVPDDGGFDFNSLASSDVTCSGTGPTWGTPVVFAASEAIMCPFTGTLAAGTDVTITIGGTNELMNPQKTEATGLADIWAVEIATRDSASDVIDRGGTIVATIESVVVTAAVEGTLTFTITGITNGTIVDGETTNSGIDSTSTAVTLGILASTITKLSAQELTVSTNASSGYVLTAQDDGALRRKDPGSTAANRIDYHVALTADDTPTSGTVMNTTGSEAYGIHACSVDIDTTRWGTNSNACTNADPSGSGGAASNLYMGPGDNNANGWYVSLASNDGPVDSHATFVTFKANISGTTEAGIYQHTVTYVASPKF